MPDPAVKDHFLSKSPFIRGLQCHKSLYLHKRHPELKDSLSEDQQARLDSGSEMGRLAQGLFPGGREIPYEGLTHAEQVALTGLEIRGGGLSHTEYLAGPGEDPRRELIARLVDEIPPGGPVMVYNQSFEIGVLNQLAAWFPEYGPQIARIVGNIVDLMGPFRQRAVYLWRW